MGISDGESERYQGMIVCSVSPSDDEGLEICKAWLKDNGHTSETHRIMRGISAVWVEEKYGQEK